MPGNPAAKPRHFSDVGRVHFLYVAGILTAVIVVLMAVEFGDQAGLVTIVSFAATLASLVLAVAAIVYAFVGNSSISHHISTWLTASERFRTESNVLLNDLRTELRGVRDSLHAVIANDPVPETGVSSESPSADEAISGTDRGALEGVEDLFRLILDQIPERGASGHPAVHLTVDMHAPRLTVPDYLRDRYPDQVLLVLQSKYADLETAEDHLSVVLWFSGVEERLEIPYSAIELLEIRSAGIRIER